MATDTNAAFPARTKRLVGSVGGEPTDAMIINFADKIVITLAQQGRLAQWFHVPLNSGRLHHANSSAPEQDLSDGVLPLVHLTPTTVLGATHSKRDAAGQLIAVQLASLISTRRKDEDRTVMLGLGLKNAELTSRSFIELIELVGDCL